jgi:hypothetical protein
MKRGTDPSAARKDDDGKTALMHAAGGSYLPVDDRLLKHGADPSAADSGGEDISLMFAARGAQTHPVYRLAAGVRRRTERCGHGCRNRADGCCRGRLPSRKNRLLKLLLDLRI